MMMPVEARCREGWVNLAPIPQPRQEHGTVAIDEKTIAIVGGIVPAGNWTVTTDLVQFYDVEQDHWSTPTSAPYKVNHPNVAALHGKLYLLGGLIVGPYIPGLNVNWVASPASYVYDVAEKKWTALPDMPSGMERGSAIVGTHRDMIYLAGGMTILQDTYQDTINSVIAFNTTSGEWNRLAPSAAELPQGRQHSSGVIYKDIFYVVGGRWFGQTNTRDTVFELNLNDLDGGWKTSKGHMPVARGGLCGGRVGKTFYSFGGEGDLNTVSGVFPQAEAFDLTSEKWIELPPMAVPRHGTQAASIGKRVYIPGGGLQQDGKPVKGKDGTVSLQHSTAHFDAYITC